MILLSDDNGESKRRDGCINATHGAYVGRTDDRDWSRCGVCPVSEDIIACLFIDGRHSIHGLQLLLVMQEDDEASRPDSQRCRALSARLTSNLSAAARARRTAAGIRTPCVVRGRTHLFHPLRSVQRSRRQGIVGCIILRAIAFIIKRITHGRCASLARSFAIRRSPIRSILAFRRTRDFVSRILTHFRFNF